MVIFCQFGKFFVFYAVPLSGVVSWKGALVSLLPQQSDWLI